MTEMRFDSAGLGYTARDSQIVVHYPTKGPDGRPSYGGGFPIGPIPEHYRRAPPSRISAERVALWDELLADETPRAHPPLPGRDRR
jgi:hypothetical protein